ncbi:hypothetical protein QBC47DRAFT_91570 [Echria macrotheca]|uniref:Uncharacterized protein n=1 Tax=Echria macrotheca TaxID=438768 RepID=A0AAJ0F6Z7_9PEZI|nr:hypothetical protein QBC47DRAFT_91570 [Echria macrotheca]
MDDVKETGAPTAEQWERDGANWRFWVADGEVEQTKQTEPIWRVAILLNAGAARPTRPHPAKPARLGASKTRFSLVIPTATPAHQPPNYWPNIHCAVSLLSDLTETDPSSPPQRCLAPLSSQVFQVASLGPARQRVLLSGTRHTGSSSPGQTVEPTLSFSASAVTTVTLGSCCDTLHLVLEYISLAAQDRHPCSLSRHRSIRLVSVGLNQCWGTGIRSVHDGSPSSGFPYTVIL